MNLLKASLAFFLFFFFKRRKPRMFTHTLTPRFTHTQILKVHLGRIQWKLWLERDWAVCLCGLGSLTTASYSFGWKTGFETRLHVLNEKKTKQPKPSLVLNWKEKWAFGWRWREVVRVAAEELFWAWVSAGPSCSGEMGWRAGGFLSGEVW